MTDVLNTGQRFTVGFLGLCSGLGILGLGRALLMGTKLGALFAFAEGVFALLAGAAAWSIYKWKALGWGIGLFVVLDWFSTLVNSRTSHSWLSIVMIFPMAAVGIWLWLPEVRAKFGLKKVFS